MAIGKIIFIKGEGGLGRALTGEDFISAFLFYTANANLPTGFSTSDRIKRIFSVADAEDLGILSDYSDATAATATYVITDDGATDDTINFTVTEINGVEVDLGTYTVLSSDSSIDLLGASLAAFINAGTITHGYSAAYTSGDDTLTLTFPKKLGLYPNSGTPITITVDGTVAGTLTQNVVAGVPSKLAIWHYHIAEYFRLQPKGQLYVGFYAVPTTYNFAEITLMQNFAEGRIRQVGVYLGGECHAYTSADLTAITNEIKTNCDANQKPLSALYAADVSGTSDLSSLTNLATLTANKSSAILGQDGAGLGQYLFEGSGKSITCLGAVLGAVSFSAVSDSIEWVGKFNFSNGTELDTPAFANGDLVKDKSQSYLTALDNNRYIFLMKYVGTAGTYANDSHTAIVISSDYAYIENNRTIDKAIRGIYASVLPAVGSPIVLNADGTLTDTSIAYFISLAETNLIQMQRDVELSEFLVEINSTQNVLSTGKLIISVKLLPIGVARQIQVNIGFTTSITSS